MIFCNVNIPYYGKGEFLHAALLGVLNQTCADVTLEVTVFDDESPEPAEAVINNLHENCCRIIRYKNNIGMVPNWNRCLEYGDKEFIHILHGDDLISSEFYLKVFFILGEYPEIGLVHTEYQSLFSRKTSSRYWGALVRKRPKHDNKNKIFRAGDEAVRHTLVMRRKAVQETGLFREDLPYSADEEYWARLAKKWAVAYIPEPLTSYRHHRNNYQLKTWLKPDFWQKFRETRHACLI